VPVARALAGRQRVTGVDISKEQIRRAEANVPAATFILGDIMSLVYPESHWDAVVAYYTLFHLPREEHPELLRRISRWLKPGGYLLATVTTTAEAAYTEEDFFGVTMYWSNYGLGDYRQMLTALGFSALEVQARGHGYQAGLDRPAEHHPLLIARLGR
jgi:ubiquinone/menaquinone biosynthesis C-methylase UbiE